MMLIRDLGFGIFQIALAVTAGLLLPIMEFVDFETQDMNSTLSLEVLSISYALVPCALKVLALLWLQNLILRDK